MAGTTDGILDLKIAFLYHISQNKKYYWKIRYTLISESIKECKTLSRGTCAKILSFFQHVFLCLS